LDDAGRRVFLGILFLVVFFPAAIACSQPRADRVVAARCLGVADPVWVSGLMEATGAIVVSQLARPRALSAETRDLTVEPLPFSKFWRAPMLIPACLATVC